ncbi:MAG: AMP-binding protein [Oryzihumus sp.]
MPTPQERVEQLLAAVEGDGVCPAELLCDGHPADAVAFTVIEDDLSSRDLTFGHLRARSEQAAAALARLGVGAGDRVATLMGKSEDLIVTLLGIWRLGATHVPLFTAFAPPAIAARLLPSGTKVVVCDAGQRSKLEPSEDIPADAPWTVVVAGPAVGRESDLLLDQLLEAESPGRAAAIRRGEDTLVQLFTSGTTGTPKGVPVPVRALAAFGIYMEYGLDVREGDVFWNAADPGWAYGLYYGVLGPLLMGRRNLLLHAGFDVALTWNVLERFKVTNLAAAPTVYRALRSGESHAPSDGLSLRVCSSAGEPLNPEVISWAEQRLGVPIRDHYGQTELGMAIVNGWHPDIREDLKPGSMGRAMPGFTAAVLEEAHDLPVDPGAQGRVAIDVPASPLMWFTGYTDDPRRTAERFSADRRWYFSGDVAALDEGGSFFFSSRDDDVIIMAGYRIGPFEVESVLVSHPDVAEAAVIGVPDELRGEVLEAYVVLRDGAQGGPDLIAALKHHVKTRYAAHAYPRSIHIIDALPKTPSGKVQRFVLRERRRAEADSVAPHPA